MNCSTSSVKQLNILLNNRPAPSADHSKWEDEFIMESDMSQFNKSSKVNWNQEFKFFNKSQDWNSEFKNQQQWSLEFQQMQNGQALDWESEFSKVLSISDQNAVPGNKIPETEVAQTASSIVNALQGHEKLKNSNFMDFMVKLQNSDLVIEKNKVVVPVQPFQEAQSALMNGKLKQVSWEEEFNPPSTQSSVSNHWNQEFNLRHQSWKNEFLSQNDQVVHNDQNYQNGFQEFWDFNGKTQKDWAKEFDGEIQKIKATPNSDPLSLQIEEFQSQDSNLRNNVLDHYAFAPFNPYLNQTHKELSEFLETSSLNQPSAERILRLEALLQQAPFNNYPSLWHQLGLAQQENENDLGAISALKNAVSLNPSQLESWLLLAASYTNEKFKADACSALESWLSNHPEYSSLHSSKVELQSLEERQNILLRKYLNAVRSSSVIDADIQIGMGILLTMKNEYEKAIDCFNAALSLRPKEYLLWNKLGATLANSNNSAEAIKAYYRALEINPTYIRARCNLAVACIQLSQYREAAEHLVTSLSIQSDMSSKFANNSINTGVQSTTVWGTLRMVVDGYCTIELINDLVNRPDLKDACDRRDIHALQRLL